MDWIGRTLQRWSDVAVPAGVFVAFLLLALWLRRAGYRLLDRWGKRTGWQGYQVLVRSTRGPSLYLCLIVSLLLGMEVSILGPGWKAMASRGLWSLFILALAAAAIGLARGLIHLYAGKSELPPPVTSLASNVAFVALAVTFLLMVLDIWGVPTSPLLLVLGVMAAVTLLAFRDVLGGLVAGMHLSTSGQIKVGDYIKLESGEEGYVIELTWRNTRLEALDASTVIIPNHRLAQSKVVNYGHPLKKAREPFRFYTRLHLTELTPLKAANLQELLGVLKKAPDPMIYYHTHHFIEEHHYLTPEPPNDFAVWVEDALGDEVLGERLASLDTFEFPTLGALRERLVGIIEEHLTRDPRPREVAPGREFHFLRSVSTILPLPYVAHDLREFVEVLRLVSPGSLFFHIFEARLRLSKGLNDFSIWIDDNLGDPELATQIARLDPYNYTLGGLRSALIQLIEKRIK